MPDVDADNARRGGRLLPVLFWAGVGLAPLAGLLLLVGGGAGLRVGGFLGVLSVMLIGLSVALRPDTSMVRLQLEELLLEEVDVLRAELREEIANAARTTHQSVGERVGALQQQLNSVRAERAAGAANPVAAAAVVPPAASAVPAYPAGYPDGYHPDGYHPDGYHPDSYHPDSRSSAPPPPVPSRSQPPDRYPAAAPVSAPAPRANGRASASAAAGVASPPTATGRRNGSRGARQQPPPEPARPPATGRSGSAGGVYRHTETVQVTRSTYVGEHPSGEEHGRGYDGGYGSREWSTVVPRSRASEAFEEAWTDEKLRERPERRPGPYDHDDDQPDQAGDSSLWSREGDRWQPVSAAPVSRSRARRWAEDDPDRSGDDDQRWSAGRSDNPVPTSGYAGAAPAGGGSASGRGRELRMGERHTARHSGEHGTELRIEERWAEVRRDDGYAAETDYGRSDHRSPDYSRRALPATSTEPSWNDSWEEPVRQSRGRRHRVEDGADYGYRGDSRQRRVDFEPNDDRWR